MKRTLFTVVFVLLSFWSFSQSGRTKDVGVIASAEISVGVSRNVGLSLEEELRFQNNCTQFDRWLNSLGVDYTFLHGRMKLGLTGDYIRRFNDDKYFENRYRAGVQLTYSETYHRFKFSFRTKLLSTFRDEATGDYRVNPKMYWRNRLQVTYQMPNSRFKYSLSTELHWLVNDPKHNIVDNLRTVASVDYRLTRRQYLSAFVRMDNDLQVKEPVDRFYFGLTYKLKY